MILGLLPEIRGGLGTLAATGQHTRFVDGYLRAYARSFDEVRYFSYRQEGLADFSRDAELAARVRVVPSGAWHPWLYAGLMGLRHGRALAECSVLRVFHLTGVIPALVARRRFGTANRERVERLFRWDVCAAATVRVYEEVLEAWRARRRAR